MDGSYGNVLSFIMILGQNICLVRRFIEIIFYGILFRPLTLYLEV